MTTQDEHMSGYQARDDEVIDYGFAELGNSGLQFRRPQTNYPSGEYFTCVGAAQTLGCFCEHPYPELLERKTGLRALNLGYGGAGPEFFLKHDDLLNYMNQGRFVVLQVMSARSQSNILYECGGLEYVTRRSDGNRMGAQRAISEALLAGPASIMGARVPTRLRKLLPNSRSRGRVSEVVTDIRRRWVESNVLLLERVEVPVILLWFSKRAPDYSERYANVAELFGDFPQLVNREMIDAVRPHAQAYTECITDRGSPQQLYSRFTGEPAVIDPSRDRADLGGNTWSANRYYPSPEMHLDAASDLLTACQRFASDAKDPQHQPDT